LLWLAFIPRLDAVISPAGTGLVYGTSASRILFGLSKNGYVPSLFETVTSIRRVPVAALIFSTLIGLAFMLPFPSWYTLVGVVTSASVLMYASAPLALGALRLSKPDLPRAYRLPAAEILCPLSFIGANFIVYWSGWGTISTLVVAMAIGYVLFILSALFNLNANRPEIDWIGAPWVLVYLIGMALISYFGQFGSGGIFEGISGFTHTLVGGNGDIPLYVDFGVVAVFSLVIYYWAMESRLSSERVDKYVHEVFPTPDSVGH
jgi:amino acid transporter